MFKRSAATSTTVHWSREFVEHLRTVHFTLVAVSVALILILSRTNSPALQQIRDIVVLKKDWPPTWITSAHASTARTESPKGNPSEKRLAINWKTPGEFTALVKWKKGNRREEIHLAVPLKNWVDTSGTLWEFPATLAEFHSWWNDLWWNNRLQGFKPRILIPVAAYDGGVYAADAFPREVESPAPKEAVASSMHTGETHSEFFPPLVRKFAWDLTQQ